MSIQKLPNSSKQLRTSTKYAASIGGKVLKFFGFVRAFSMMTRLYFSDVFIFCYNKLVIVAFLNELKNFWKFLCIIKSVVIWRNYRLDNVSTGYILEMAGILVRDTP